MHDGTQAVWKTDSLPKNNTASNHAWEQLSSSDPGRRRMALLSEFVMRNRLWCNVIVSIDSPFLNRTLFLLHSPDVNIQWHTAELLLCVYTFKKGPTGHQPLPLPRADWSSGLCRDDRKSFQIHQASKGHKLTVAVREFFWEQKQENLLSI